MHLDKLDDKWMIAGQNRQQDRAEREKGFSGNLLLPVTQGIHVQGQVSGMYTQVGSSKAKWLWTGTVQMKILPVDSRD